MSEPKAVLVSPAKFPVRLVLCTVQVLASSLSNCLFVPQWSTYISLTYFPCITLPVAVTPSHRDSLRLFPVLCVHSQSLNSLAQSLPFMSISSHATSCMSGGGCCHHHGDSPSLLSLPFISSPLEGMPTSHSLLHSPRPLKS